MNIHITNRQKTHRISLRRVMGFLSWIAQNLQSMSPATKWSELSLVLTDNAGIKRINSRYLRAANTTDVISFRYAPIPGANDHTCGEVFVNVERAVEIGPIYSGSSRELALYIAHGCDHLAGQSDYTRVDYIRMRRRELRWLRKAGAAGLLKEPLIIEPRSKRSKPS